MNIEILNKTKWAVLLLAVILFFSSWGIQGCMRDHAAESKATSVENSQPVSAEFAEIKWPTIGVATLLPTPESTYGKIGSDSSSFFSAYIGNTTKEQYNAYVEKCIDLGFAIDYSKSSSSFWADNSDGYHCTVNYNQQESYMSISINDRHVGKTENANVEAASTTPAETPTVSSSSSPTTETTTDSAADFKKTMDSYEAFFDEYISFMKKYNESGNSPAMIGDYTKFMAQYTDTMSKLNSLDTGDLTPDEEAYYIEVMARINQKLADAALNL